MMATDTPTEDLDTTTEVELNPLQELQTAIASLPAVDKERVEAVMQKLRDGKLDILSNDKNQQASAERIAQKIIDEIAETDS